MLSLSSPTLHRTRPQNFLPPIIYFLCYLLVDPKYQTVSKVTRGHQTTVEVDPLEAVASKHDELIYPTASARIFSHSQTGSYFGYSLGAYVGQSQPFCLVGSPKASSVSDIDPDQESNRDSSSSSTGVVYRLDLDPDLPDCRRVPIATTDEERMEYDTPVPGVSSWLGGSVSAASNSHDGIQLGCDPHYLYATQELNNSADLSSLIDTDRKSLHSRTYIGTGQCALYTGTSMRYTSVDACLGQEEGSCLSGFSSDVEPGSQPGEAFVALGLPGSYLTEGNIFLGHYRGRQLVSASRLKNSPTDFKHRGFNLGFAVDLAQLTQSNNNRASADSLLLHGRGDDEGRSSANSYHLLASSSMWLDNNYKGIVMILNQALDIGGIRYLKDNWGHVGSFFGYSLATADLNGDGLTDIIVGAPYFSEFDDLRSDQSIKSNKSPLKKTSSRESLVNDQPFSERQDEEVEKNEQSSRSASNIGSILPDVGRVYIFYASRADDGEARIEFQSESVQLLTGPRQAGGRFGHAMTSLGDLDGDGTGDLAISCPFCVNDEDGRQSKDGERRSDRGAVFIYLGRQGHILDQKPFQIIWSSALSSQPVAAVCGYFDFDQSITRRPFKAFGWSLSGGTDLDDNRAPDLMIGDFESDQVVFLRARNTIWFESPEWKIPIGETLPWIGQFRVALSTVINGRANVGSIPLLVSVDLDDKIAELVNKRVVLLKLDQVGHRSSDDLVESIQLLFGQSRLEFLVKVKGSILQRPNAVDRRLTLFQLTLESIPDRVRSLIWQPLIVNASISLADSNQSLLHPFTGSSRFTSQPVYFTNPDCGKDNVCTNDLGVQIDDISSNLLHDDKSSGGRDGQSSGYYSNHDNRQQQHVIYFRERVGQRNISIRVWNWAENAYQAQLRVTIPNQLSFALSEKSARQCKIEMQALNNKATDLVCGLGDPLAFTSNRPLEFVIQINTGGAFNRLDDHQSNDLQSDDPNTSQPASSSVSDVRHVASTRARRRRDDLHDDSILEVEEEDDESVDQLKITARVVSGNEDKRETNNEANLTYNLQLAAKIELSSSSRDHTTIDPRNFSVQLYAMQRVRPETIGPEVKHIYLLSNAGPSPIANLTVNISLPVQTESDQHLFYLLDQLRYQSTVAGTTVPDTLNVAPQVVSADGHVRGSCETPEWALNPLKLNVVQRPSTSKQRKASSHASTNQQSPSRRSKRWISEEGGEEAEEEKEKEVTVRPTRSVEDSTGGGVMVRKRRQEVARCGKDFAHLGPVRCAIVKCKIDQLARGDAVRIAIRGWVWADTFFRHELADLAIVSEARVYLPDKAFGIDVSGNLTAMPLTIGQNFVFKGIQIPIFREIPLWPIILGGIMGLILLGLIVFGMWKCGFFRRKRWYDVPKDTTAVVPTDL